MDLLDIQPAVQQIADAIASVLKIEVEIANDKFIRIAGTGKQETSVLHKMEGDLVYQSAIRTGRSVIIENPGFEEVCKRCQLYRNCPETGEICTPIFYKHRSIGVIGLLAFNEEQRQRLFENPHNILEFLNKMAELIASKLHEHEMIEKLQTSSNKLVKMMDLVEQGIMVLDHAGHVKEMNVKAKVLLHVDEQGLLSPKITSLLTKFISDTTESRKTIHLPINQVGRSFYLIKQPLNSTSKLSEYLIIIQAVDEIQHLAEQTTKVWKEPFEQIIGHSQPMREIKEYAYRVAQSNSTILIQGESGTGKEEFAKAIHRSSPRKDQPLITVNCAAIPEQLLESELFGYEEGAFTGAKATGKAGKFELANGGTIFLDEIGEMPPLLQSKLLRVLQQREVERLGGTKTIPLDLRVIAATNQDLQNMVAEGKFREDLYYRLNVIPIIIPPLRNRKEDILALTDYFIRVFNDSFQANVLGFENNVKELMLHHTWPGNVRELRNFIEYLFNFFKSGWITMQEAGPMIRKKLDIKPTIQRMDSPSFSLEQMEKEMIQKAIHHVKQHKGNIEDASHLLGIGRATLFRKMKKYQIDT